MRTCPTGARHFGDLGDPGSDVSKLVAERGGYDLMPEQGTKPVNKYLPPRPRGGTGGGGAVDLVALAGKGETDGFWKWVDSALDSLSPKG